ncbi:hypothetical protein PVL29_000495 [Vitis rotundifolia]|uniref:Uncharacterized protein n=1 Tax=Vitis rotundifolia TaxID=103349 RepID=A0AA39AJ00_VITRO|nr:hypothetical protein PVL29_000495 [Vitis rotundifolia]
MEIHLNDCKEYEVRVLMKSSPSLKMQWEAPRQIEPGSQTEQALPSAVFHLGRMHGFRFVIIPVVSSLTVSCSFHNYEDEVNTTRFFFFPHTSY